MVATDDGAGGDDKMEDSCNGNEATTAAALVSQMSAGEPMQVDGDGNFVLPQVDGPIDDLLLEGEEKMDVDEEPASENASESAGTESAITEQNASTSEVIQTEESTEKKEIVIKEEITVKEEIPAKEEIAVKNEEEATTNLPESITANQTALKVESVSNPPAGDKEVSMETNDNVTELPSEKEIKDPIVSDVIKSELPLVQSSTEASSEQMPLADATNSAMEIDETQQDEKIQMKKIKNESFSENEKSLTSEDLLTEDTDASHPPQDDTQKVEKIKDAITKVETDLPIESSLVKSNDADEPMITDNSTSTSTDNVIAPTVTPSVQMKLEPNNEPPEQDKLSDLPISSINGVAAPIEKEMEKIHIPVKMEIKEDLAIQKRENQKQEKINDARPETGDDSTALTTLATAALGSAEPAIKVKNEQVDYINFLHRLLLHQIKYKYL